MGQGDMGQLGLGEDVVELKKPHPVGGVLEGSEVIQVVCGGMHTVVLTKDGKVRNWLTFIHLSLWFTTNVTQFILHLRLRLGVEI